jgi:hypothetical protein
LRATTTPAESPRTAWVRLSMPSSKLHRA